MAVLFHMATLTRDNKLWFYLDCPGGCRAHFGSPADHVHAHLLRLAASLLLSAERSICAQPPPAVGVQFARTSSQCGVLGTGSFRWKSLWDGWSSKGTTLLSTGRAETLSQRVLPRLRWRPLPPRCFLFLSASDSDLARRGPWPV